MAQRKGGSGFTGSPREAFNYYKKQLRRRYAEEQAGREALGKGTLEAFPQNIFKRLDYKSVFEEGITRKRNGVTVRITGEEAVQLQIESMRARASKSFQTDRFIQNYMKGVNHVFEGEDPTKIAEIERLLRSVSIDKLTLLLDKDAVPQIRYLYMTEESIEEVTEHLREVLKSGTTSQEVKQFRERRKALIPLVKERQRILRG